MPRTVMTLAAFFVTITASVLAQTNRNTEATTIALDAPPWLKEYNFRQNKFTFVRIQYDSALRGRSSWATDYPDADKNLAAQIGRLTKLDVSKSATHVLRLTDPSLPDYPFIYISEAGTLSLNEAEIKALRKYLDAGGFLMVDDFWGDKEWENLRLIMRQAFPDREPIDLPVTHPLFHCVFDLKEKPQVASIHAFLAGQKFERVDAREAHYRAIQDDRGRVMVVMCHNTDLADGWERVGVDEAYTREMSKAKAFPMGINIIFYALTQTKPQ